MEESVRVHGFRWPLHPLQVLSWVVFGGDVLVYLIICIPMIETVAAQVVVTSCFVISVIFLVVSTFIATKCDPMDPYVLRDESLFKEEELDELPYCGLCATTVQARSKHCRVCKKCVDCFDHHCMWLNNCIGGDNYRAFFVSISSVAVMIGIVLGTILYQIIDLATNEGFVLRLEASVIHQDLTKEAFLVILIVMSLVNVPLWVLDMQLVFLHTYLVHQNLTTYEYITNKREDSGEGRFKGLPGWMDWIVFSRCGRRRKKKDKPPPAEEKKTATGELVDSEVVLADRTVVAKGTPPGCAEDPPNEAGAPSAPPGSRHAELPLYSIQADSNPDLRAERHDRVADRDGREIDEVYPLDKSEKSSPIHVACGCDGSSALSNRDTDGKAAV